MIWPAVFDGVGALVVSSALDPEQLVEKIDRHSGAGALSWIAPKLTGTDTGGDLEVRHAINVWRGLGLNVGGWIYNVDPMDDVNSVMPWVISEHLDFVVYDVERPYKVDEGGVYEFAAELVSYHSGPPAAVTSYGGYKTSIDFASFARAGWPILAQCYDAFHDGDELTYLTSHGGVYQDGGVHRLVRRLNLSPGESVYRPEGIDG